jgi:hypothetical protein
MPLKGKVDASDYGPEEVLDADVKTGMRPISRRAYKSGGKVSGECGPMRADRKPRNSGGKATTPNSMINRNNKDANEDREGKKHVGALARGGAAKSDKSQDKALVKKAFRQHENAEHGGKHVDLKLKNGGMPHKGGGGASGLKLVYSDDRIRAEREIDRENALSSLQRQMDLHQDNEDWDKHDAASAEYDKISKRKNYAPPHRRYENGLKRGGAPKATTVSDGEYQGTRPTGGRLARASGGKTGKGKMNVNIIISTGSKGQGPQPGMPGGPLGTPPGGLIAAPPPPSAPPPALPPPPMGGPPGAMGGAPMGGMPPLPRKSGGRTGHGVYRTYKDMDAGSGGGLGRLEKVEIQEHKK